MKIRVINETKRKVDRKLLHRIEAVICQGYIQLLGNTKINLILKTKSGIVDTNNEVFGREYVTDVISVNSQSPVDSDSFLGDVYICSEMIEENAKSFGSTYREEFARVVIHGILHLLGFDHKKSFGESKEKMFEVQEKILSEAIA